MGSCAVCGSSGLEPVWELAKLPLTGIYVTNPNEEVANYFHDQILLHCPRCSHTQLSMQVDPEWLYRKTYSHRTSESPISRAGNDFLLRCITELLGNSTPDTVVELGCNDVYLLEGLSGTTRNLIGIDPIWLDTEPKPGVGVRLVGAFAEEVDYDEVLDGPIDLLVSAHTFEHLFDPARVVASLRGRLSNEATVVIEVPSAERMLAQARLDQVFSQHVHYYSASSMARLWESLDLTLVDLIYNYNYWGGTQILVFRRSPTKSFVMPRPPSTQSIVSGIEAFRRGLELTKWQMRSVEENLVAFGAAQMLPILDYHLGGMIGICSRILDDNPTRQDTFFPFMSNPIVSGEAFQEWTSSTVVISALDSGRPLTQIARERQARTIITPLGLL